MIKKLSYDVKFALGGSRSNTAEFESGSTLITGKNGRGKSLNLELIAYALFGTVALRGKKEDYKGIKVELEVAIRGIDYRIKRTKSGGDVFDAKGEKLATGNVPVNDWVIEKLGFNYDVFRVAHWCAQGDIQALAEMKPAERKKMVDSVAGLTQMDGLSASVAEQVSLLTRSVKTAEEYAVKPTPIKKPDLQPVAKIRAYVAELETEIYALRETENRLLQITLPVEPTLPRPVPPLQLPDEPQQIAPQLKQVEKFVVPEQYAKLDLDQSLADLTTRLNALTSQEAELNSVRASLNYVSQEIVNLGTRPLNLEQIQADNKEIEAAKYKRMLLSQGDSVCPNCNTEHPIATTALADYANVDVNRADETPMLKGTVKAHAKYLEDLKRLEELTEAIVKLPRIQALYSEFRQMVKDRNTEREAIQYNEQQIENVRVQNQQAFEQHERNLVWAKQTHEQNVAAYNHNRSQYEANLSQYHAVHEEYNAAKAKWVESGEEELANAQLALSAEREKLTLWAVYDSDLKTYEENQARYSAQKDRIKAEKAVLEDYQRAKKSLAEIKHRVKSYVVPSLNQVASLLLNEMTGGEYAALVVDEDFEVTVDAQPLRTLSGSAKDIANLAIRIALGRILTHSVLPVMMFDEIDAAMDNERAEYTWQSIQRVTKQIGQVLQVSHKNLSSEHTIEVQ